MSLRSGTSYERLGWLVCSLPLLAALVFVYSFAGPLPLTDEWNYSHALRLLHGLDLTNWSQLSVARELYPTRLSEHLVVLPFLVYAPLMELFHYDSRVIIYLTVASFAGQVWLMRSLCHGNPWIWLLVALITFAPSHYMEFMWAWQITLTWSVLFPLWGLKLIARPPPENTPRQILKPTASGLVVITLGTLSSAGGFFGYPAALVLVALQPGSIRSKLVSGAIISIVGGLVFTLLMGSGAKEFEIGLREFWYVLTALGATLWGSPVALLEFKFNELSAAGMLGVIALLAAVARAVITKNLSALALPLSITVFGFLCVIPIAMTRGYLGNWHLQYALPIWCGALTTAYGLHRRDGSNWSLVPFVTLSVLVASTAIGYVRGFTLHGPDYRDYAGNIEEYARMKLVEPWRGRSYPEQAADRDMDLDLILFLSAHQHPTFTVDSNESAQVPLPRFSAVWINAKTAPLPITTSVFHDQRPSRLVVGFPPDKSVTAVVASWGDTQVILHRVHPDHLPAVSAPPHTHLFVADIYPEQLPTKPDEVEFSILQL